MTTRRNSEERCIVPINVRPYPSPAPPASIDDYLARHPVVRVVELGATSTIVRGRDEAHADELARESLAAMRERLTVKGLKRLSSMSIAPPTTPAGQRAVAADQRANLSLAAQADRANARRARERKARMAAEEAARALPPIEIPTRERVMTCGPMATADRPPEGWPALVERRIDEHTSVRELARAMGCSREIVRRWRRGVAEPTGSRARWLLGPCAHCGRPE